MLRKFSGLVMLSALLAVPTLSIAAESSGPRNALLSWGEVTKNTDGSDVSKPVAYKVYRGTSTSQCGTSISQTTSLQVLLTMQPLGRQCYCVTAVAAGAESTPAGPICKTMRLPAPTEGSIEKPTEGSIER